MKGLFFIALLFITANCFAQAKNNNASIYNVKLFGAVGNGVTNDTRAIQTAITACSANGGGIEVERWRLGLAGATRRSSFLPRRSAR